MRGFVVLILSLAAATAQAQTYKCVVGGKTVYADVPCAPDARNVGAMQDSLSEDQRIQRLQQSIKERRQRNSIEGQQNAEYEHRDRMLAQQAANEAAQARARESSRQRKCSNLDYDIKSNQRGVARYQDFGWQRSLSQQEAELKSNREAYDRDCR